MEELGNSIEHGSGQLNSVSKYPNLLPTTHIGPTREYLFVFPYTPEPNSMQTHAQMHMNASKQNIT